MKNPPFEGLRQLNGPILITGHTGFKGTWLMCILNALEIEYVGFSLPAEKDSLYERGKFQGKQPETFGDIRDLSGLKLAIQKFNPSAVLHLAAQPLVLKSYENPLMTFETNVTGTTNVLNLAWHSENIEAVGVITTDKVYKNENIGRRFKETDPLEGKDPYSASKVATEAVVSAWKQISLVNGGPNVFSLRAGNVIGGGDYAENRLIPDAVRAHVNRTALEIRNPESTRPWQHVLDPLLGYLQALDLSIRNHSTENYNFGPTEDSLKVREVIEKIKDSWPIDVETKSSSGNHESHLLDLDSTKAAQNLGWFPRYNQLTAIEKTIEWWESYLQGDSAEEICMKQTTDYLLGDS